MFNSGFIKSNLVGVSSFTPVSTSTLPSKFDMRDELSEPIDQGNRGICVSVCATDMVSYAFTVAGKKYKKKVDFYYSQRQNKKSDGMSPRDAFEIAERNELISSYAMLKGLMSIKIAIAANGPAMIALPVYDYDSYFWKSAAGGLLGFHAVTLVGFNDEDEVFTLRNSWGDTWANQGYTQFPYSDIDVIMEAWTIFR